MTNGGAIVLGSMEVKKESFLSQQIRQCGWQLLFLYFLEREEQL